MLLDKKDWLFQTELNGSKCPILGTIAYGYWLDLELTLNVDPCI